MPVEVGHAARRRMPGRAADGRWVLGLVLALALGAVVVRSIVVRDRSPLATRPLLVRTLDHPLILLGDSPYNRFDPPTPMSGPTSSRPVVVS